MENVLETFKISSLKLRGKNEAEQFIKQYFGMSAVLDYYYKNDRLVVGASIPTIIKDSRDGKKKINFLKFNQVFEVFLKNMDDSIEITYPNLKEIDLRLQNLISQTYQKMEILLLKNTKDKIINIPNINNALTPFRTIVETIIREGIFSAENYHHFTIYKNQKRVLQYLSLLEELEIIKKDKESQNWTGGNLLTIIQKENESKKVIDTILFIILSNNYEYLHKYLKITAMMPYIRLSNAYYYPSVYNGEMLYLQLDDLIQSHKKIYPKMSIPKSRKEALWTELNRLADPKVGILNIEDDKYVIGTEDIFKNLTTQCFSSD